MKIVVVGPGAMGCLFAGLLTEARGATEQDVWLLDNDAARAAAIAENGVRIELGSESRVIRVNITADPTAIAFPDILFLFVKAYDTGSAIRYAAPLLGDHTTVVSLQNGAGNVEEISEIIDGSSIVRGATAYGSTGLGTGHVRHAGTGPTVVAPVVPSSAGRADAVAEVLNAAGIDTEVGDSWLGLVWNKIIINAAINPLAAVSDVPNGRLVEDAALRKMLREIACEAMAVARAKGISVVDSVAEVEEVCRKTSENISSMLQDVRNKRPTEIDWITGVVVREARALGIPVPMNEMLLTRVHEMAEDGTSA
jgi:2-dehydropantoate 2-reductase